MSKKNKWYLYAFCDLRKPGKYVFNDLNVSFLYKPFYIGKGINDRYKHHKYDKSESYKSNLIQKLLLKYDIDDLLIKLQNDLPEKLAYDLEIDFISKIGRFINGGPLTNLLPGGEGMSSEWMKKNNPMFKISTEQHSKTIKEKHWSGERGKRRKQQLSEKVSGSNNPSSKKYLILEPNGKIHFIKGLKTWCFNRKYSINIFRNWIDRGVIGKTFIKDKSIFLPEKRKLIGWEIKEVSKLKFKEKHE